MRCSATFSAGDSSPSRQAHHHQNDGDKESGTPWAAVWIVALSPGAKSQAWKPKVGATNDWRWVTRHPKPHMQCQTRFDTRICGKKVGHKEECEDWLLKYPRE